MQLSGGIGDLKKHIFFLRLLHGGGRHEAAERIVRAEVMGNGIQHGGLSMCRPTNSLPRPEPGSDMRGWRIWRPKIPVYCMTRTEAERSASAGQFSWKNL